MKKKFKNLSRKEYTVLKDLGLLFELFPQAIGNYNEDIKKKKKKL